MDAFFAGVEQLDDPCLRGKQVLVGGVHRGVVCAASYPARAFGVRSAMPMAEAIRRCPQAVVVAPRHRRYQDVSRQIFAVFNRYTPLVEGLSVDEAFLDVSGSLALFGPAAQIARLILDELQQTLGLSASAGVAPCKFVAKVASDMRKPGGLVEVLPADVVGFLRPLPIEKMWGVGKVVSGRLRRAGYARIGDLADAPAGRLAREFGRLGDHLAALCTGDDPRPVQAPAAAKSMGSEQTFEQDVHDLEGLKPALLTHALSVASRLRDAGCGGRTLTVKVKTNDFVLATRQHKLPVVGCDPDALYAVACSLLPRFGLSRPVRLVGLSVSDLEPLPMAALFVDPQAARRERLEAVRAAVSQRFGEAARLTRASVLADETS
jgi:DNA polymerase-4